MAALAALLEDQEEIDGALVIDDGGHEFPGFDIEVAALDRDIALDDHALRGAQGGQFGGDFFGLAVQREVSCDLHGADGAVAGQVG